MTDSALATKPPLVLRWLANRPACDLLLAGALAWATWRYAPDRLPDLEVAGRRAVYQALTGLAGTLLGLTVTTTGLLLANLDKPLVAFQRGLPPLTVRVLGRSLFSLMRALAYLCLVALALLVIDTAGTDQAVGHWWTQAALTPLILLVSVRLTRATFWLWRLLLARAGPLGAGTSN